MAFDITIEYYWGKNGSLNVRQIKHENGASEAFFWLNVSIVRPIPLHLMALPFRQGDDLATKTIELLEYCMSLRFKIKLCLFDRGFYIGHLIDFLEAKRLPYLMLVPENDVMKRYAEQTDIIKDFKHEMIYSKDKSKWKPKTKIVVIKGLKYYNLYFATSLPTSLSLARIYPRRWQIETNFRVIDEAKIKSKSNVHIIRYFYFLVQLLLHMAWNVTKKLYHKLSFKKIGVSYLQISSEIISTISNARTPCWLIA